MEERDKRRIIEGEQLEIRIRTFQRKESRGLGRDMSHKRQRRRGHNSIKENASMLFKDRQLKTVYGNRLDIVEDP